MPGGFFRWRLAALLLVAAVAARAEDKFLLNMHKGDSRTDPEEKIEYFTRAIRAWAPGRDASLLSYCHLKRGEAFYLRADVEAAQADLSEAVALDPRNSGAYFLRGKIFLRMRESARAARDFAESAAIAGNPEAYWLLGEAREKERGYEGAAKAYEQAARLAPDDFHPPLGLARVSLARKNPERALELLDSADRLAQGRSAEVLVQRGRCYGTLGERAQALDSFKAAVALYEKRLAELHRSLSSPLAVADVKDALASTYAEMERLLPSPAPAAPKKKRRKIKSGPGERIYAN